MGFLDKFKKKKAAPPRKAGPETENYTSGGSAVCRYEARENRGFRPPEDVRVSMGPCTSGLWRESCPWHRMFTSPISARASRTFWTEAVLERSFVMDFKEAMYQRHTVRRYTGKRIPEDIVERLNRYIREINERYGVSVVLKTEDTQALPAVIKLTLARGVRNYFIMCGEDRADLEETLGYCGAGLMLYAQTLGLNTWWVGGTFSRKRMTEMCSGRRVIGVAAVGYGQTQGVPHKSKAAGQIGEYDGAAPPWFERGIEAALLAPTALGKQAFTIRGRGNLVTVNCDNGIFSGVDTGLVKYHFELGAGKENFEWAQA